MNVLIDPYVIAIPPSHSSEDRILSYVEGIETWLVTPYPFVKMLCPLKCVACLIEANQFPFRHNVGKLLSAARSTEYDAEDISRLSATLLTSWEAVEDVLRIDAIFDQLTVMPTFFGDRLPQAASELFLDCLGKVVLQKNAGDRVLAELYIGSTPDDAGNIATKLIIRATVTDIEVDTNDLEFGSTPMQVNSELPVLLGHEDILNSIDWTVIWEYPRLAIEKAYYSVIPFNERAVYGLGNYVVGSRFLDTIVAQNLHSQAGRVKSIYETCALVSCRRATQLQGINPRPLRGNARATDGARPMRADISQRHAGYRLLYWQCRDESIELSCIGVHNDVTIY